jgi:hypothetical protein
MAHLILNRLNRGSCGEEVPPEDWRALPTLCLLFRVSSLRWTERTESECVRVDPTKLLRISECGFKKTGVPLAEEAEGRAGGGQRLARPAERRQLAIEIKIMI